MATALPKQVADSVESDAVIDADAIALYDGRCGLCNRLLRFATKRACPGAIEFLTLQSERGGQLQAQFGVDPQQLDSMILIEKNHAFERSDAALRVLKHLRQPWPMLSALLIIPRPIRNRVYDWIARNRTRWFGTCELPAHSDDSAQNS